MDVGRSCFKKWFRFFAPEKRNPTPGPPRAAIALGTPRPLTRVRWYVAPEGAKVFPVPHCWGSSAFYDDEQAAEWDIGEYPYEQEYDKGRTPVGATGQRYCGKESDFTGPKPWTNKIASPDRNANGLPKCCCNAPAGCGAIVLTNIGTTCACCPGKSPDSFRVHTTAPGYPFDGLEMDCPLFASSPCEWDGELVDTPTTNFTNDFGSDALFPGTLSGGFSYRDDSTGRLLFHGQVTFFTTLTCTPFYFREYIPIYDQFDNPTGDYAIMEVV